MSESMFDASDAHLLAAELDAMPAETVRKVRGSLTRHINKIASQARANAPRDRPWLAENIRHDTRGLGRRVYSPPDPTNKNRPVGLFVEFGTSRQPPQPFLYPALDAVAPEFEADVDRIIAEGLE